MEKWKSQWETLVSEILEKQKIQFEKTSFQISPDLKKIRENDWEVIIRDRQFLKLIMPKSKGAKIKLQAINENDLPVTVGTIEYFDDSIDYKIGLTGHLIEKRLDYANGDTRYCLEFDQPIFLIASETIPEEVSKIVELRTKGKKLKPIGTGCFSIALLIVFLILCFMAFEINLD